MAEQPDVRYIVIHVHPDVQRRFPFLASDHGKWINRPTALPLSPVVPVWQRWTACATGRYEQRDDGALAEIYEVNP